MPTFANRLQSQLRSDPGRPFVTFYDFESGERTELSVATYANWVAKAASLLVDEHGLERGDVVRVDLPAHWLGPVFLGAAWTGGLVVDLDAGPGSAPAAVVCGPDGLPTWAPAASSVPVLAASLLPLGVRFATPLPAGVHDIGVEVWSQPDSFIPADPPDGDDLAVRYAGTELTQAQLWEAATIASHLADGGRLLTTVNPASPPGLTVLTEPLERGGSVVLATPAGSSHRERLDATYAAERCTSSVLA